MANVEKLDDELQMIIIHGSESEKARATEELLKRPGITDFALRMIIIHCPVEYKARAAEELLKRPTADSIDLYVVITDCPVEEHKAKAWERLLERRVGYFTLEDIIDHGPEKYKAKAYEQLLKQGDTSDLIRLLGTLNDEYRIKVAKELIKRKQMGDSELQHPVISRFVWYWDRLPEEIKSELGGGRRR